MTLQFLAGATGKLALPGSAEEEASGGGGPSQALNHVGHCGMWSRKTATCWF